MFVGKRAVFVEAANLKSDLARRHNVPLYPTFESCFNDRHRFRAFWFDAISRYNDEDPARLGKELFAEYDMYVGLRSAREFAALKDQGAFNHSIWIDASKRLPPESADSMTITPEMAMIRVDNNGTLHDLHRNLDALMAMIGVFALTKIDEKCK